MAEKLLEGQESRYEEKDGEELNRKRAQNKEEAEEEEEEEVEVEAGPGREGEEVEGRSSDHFFLHQSEKIYHV